MTDRQIKLILGSLLHDIGKVIYRQGDDHRNHSQSGFDYLKEEVELEDREILNCVRYHHGAALRGASLEKHDLSYIVYLADNIAAAADRRKKDEDEKGFELSMPLQSVFNILHGNHQEMYYSPGDLEDMSGINYPGEEKKPFTEEFYGRIRQRLTDNLKGIDWTEEYVNSLLAVMEANLTFVPSSTAKGELADISLYDHVKLTAAVAGCIYEYLEEREISDYKTYLFENSAGFYGEEAFALCSLDISGIQDFIYTITSKNALRTLRARSFYLEILMEHIIDCLLERMNLSRANLIYSGGGHCYLLFPNTRKAKNTLDQYLAELNRYFIRQHKNALYIAGAFVPCSCNTLKNEPQGSYSEMFRKLGAAVSEKKLRRYTAEEIREMNRMEKADYSRECKVCRTVGKVDADGVCTVCRKFERLSANVLYSEFFTVLFEGGDDGVPLPGGYVLVADNESSLRKRMSEDPYFVRTYAKNRMYTGHHIATRLWTGDYTTGQTFEEFAKASEGIGRIGVLRADVDNLGQTFISGFDSQENANRYVTLSRTAVLSRQLSMFFKYHIRDILANGQYGCAKPGRKRNVTIVYSGGDDVFLVGAWNDIVECAVDLRRSFRRYTQGTLTLSAGIGIYEPGYPVSAIADETGEMEEESKRLPSKNAVTLLEDGERHEADGLNGKISDGTYSWDVFEAGVLEEKYRTIEACFDSPEDSGTEEFEERGMSFLYHLLLLIRRQDEKVNFARFIYLLSRLEPQEDGPRKRKYQSFSRNMCEWVRSEEDCRQLKTAITLYAYRKREKGE